VHGHRDKIYARAMMMMRNEEEAMDLSQEAWGKHGNGCTNFRVIPPCHLDDADRHQPVPDQIRRQKKMRAESIEQIEEEAGRRRTCNAGGTRQSD
jgi:hypothetical protein